MLQQCTSVVSAGGRGRGVTEARRGQPKLIKQMMRRPISRPGAVDENGHNKVAMLLLLLLLLPLLPSGLMYCNEERGGVSRYWSWWRRRHLARVGYVRTHVQVNACSVGWVVDDCCEGLGCDLLRLV